MPGKRNRIIAACEKNGSKRTLTLNDSKSPVVVRLRADHDEYDLIGLKSFRIRTGDVHSRSRPLHRLGVKFAD